jgi:pyridoxine 4-dehydrogenase
MRQSTQRTQSLEGLQVAHNDSYSPLGWGILTGQFKSFEDLSQKDIQRTLPRFQSKDFEINMKLVKEPETVASKKKGLPSQLGLGWLLNLSKQERMPEVIPIPGASTAERVKEELSADSPE